MPKLNKGESKSDYVSKCIKHRQGKEKQDESIKRSAKACYEIYKDKKKKKGK